MPQLKTKPKQKKLLLGMLIFLVLFSFGFNLIRNFIYAPVPVRAAAGINKQINFQGKLVNPNGTNVTDGSYTIVFSIYSVSSAGTAIWTETQTPTVTNGIFQVSLGSVTSLPGSVDFNTDNIYLGIKVGADAEMNPRIRFSAVPQAFNAEKLGGIDKDGFIQNGTSPQSGVSFNIGGNGTVGGGSLTVGTTSQAGSIIVSDGSSNTATIQVGNLSGNYIYSIPVTTTNDTFCLVTLGNCSGTAGGNANTALSNLSSVAINASLTPGTDNTLDLGSSANSWRTLYADTSVITPLLNAGTASAAGSLAVFDGNGQKTTLTAGDSATDLAFILPTTVGSSNQCLKNSGTAGTLTFANCNNGSGAGGNVTLNDAYTAGNTITTTTARDINFTMADTATDSSTVFNLQCTTCSANGGRFAVQNAGTDVLVVAPNSGGVSTTITSTTAFVVQNTSSLNVLAADTSSALKVNVGSSTTDANAVLMVVDSYNGASDVGLTGFNGSIYYNSSMNKFRCYQNGAWTDCIGSGGSGANTALSNLSSVAINASLTPGTDNTLDLGSSANSWRTLYADTSVLAPLLDTASTGVLNVGTTNASQINLNKNVVVAAGQYISLVGGITSTRPASPTEGMLYYDTTTKQLLTYANGKWQADRSNAILVAANNSSDADKAAADYVATGTNDQTTINNALTAADPAGSGLKTGKVYLLAGTYVTSSVISVPNNTTLAGSGKASIIRFANINGQTQNMVTNATTGGNGTGIVIRDLELDGNRSVNVSGTQYGVYLNGMGNATTGLEGGLITNLWVTNFLNRGIYLNSSNYVQVANNYLYGNADGIYVNGTRNTVLNNHSHDNNNTGIALNGMLYGVVYGNMVHSNAVYGIAITGNASNNTVTSNTLRSNGGGSTNNAIFISNSDANMINNNAVTDAGCTTNCYAVNIFDNTSDNNYLSDNNFDTGTINDLGTGTIYANQLDASGNLLNRSQGGGFSVGKTSANASLSLQGGLVSTQLTVPTLSATVANVGTAGSTTYRYQVTALDGTGETTGSTIQQTTTGNATLTSSNYNTITWTQVGGAVQYRIYRCTGAACTPALLTTVNGNATSYDDTANGSPSVAVPSSNTTGGASFAGALQGSSSLSLGTTTVAGSVSLSDGSSNTATIQVGNLAGNYTYSIPVTTANDTFCLVTLANCASSGITTVGAFSGTSYANGANISGNTITFGPADASNPGMVSTSAQTFAGTKTFNSALVGPGLQYAGTLALAGTGGSGQVTLATAGTTRITIGNSGNVTYSGGIFSLQNAASDRLLFDTSNSILKVYDSAGSGVYASISASSTGATFAASSGTTTIGTGSGDVTSNLTGLNDDFSFSKTYTAAANYSNTDFTIQRSVTGGSNTLTGAILKVEDLSTATTASSIQPSVLLLNQSNASATGYLLNAQSAGVSKVTIANSGAVNIVSSATAGSFSSNVYDGSGALTVGNSTATSITIGRTAITTSLIGTIQLGPNGTDYMSISSTTGEPTLNGAARHTRKITLAAEYAGGSMTADGSNNTGTMTTDNMTSSPFRNFYKWTTTQGTAQDYDIWVRIPLPSDFAAMPSGQTICIDTYASSTAANGVAVTLYGTNNSSVTLTDSDLTPSSTSTWQNQCTSSITGGTFAADGVMTLAVKLTAPATTGDIRIGDITLNYLSKW